MEFIIAICAAFIVGLTAGYFAFKRKASGALRIVTMLEDGEDYLFLDLDESVDKIASKKFVTFKVTLK